VDVYFRRQCVIHPPFDMGCDSDVFGEGGFGLIKAPLQGVLLSFKSKVPLFFLKRLTVG